MVAFEIQQEFQFLGFTGKAEALVKAQTAALNFGCGQTQRLSRRKRLLSLNTCISVD
jgi:hypothetical protein